MAALKYLQCRSAGPLAVVLVKKNIRSISEGRWREPKSWAHLNKDWILINDPDSDIPMAVELIKNPVTKVWEEHRIAMPEFMLPAVGFVEKHINQMTLAL